MRFHFLAVVALVAWGALSRSSGAAPPVSPSDGLAAFATVRAVLQQYGHRAQVAAKSGGVEGRISAGVVHRGLGIVAHVHGGAGLNQRFHHGTRRHLAGTNDEISPPVAGLKTVRLFAEQFLDITCSF